MKNKKGVALLVTLFTLLLASLLLVGFLQVVTSDLRIMHNHYLKGKVMYIAEAGAEYAFSLLRSGSADFSQTIIFPQGSQNTYSVTYSNTSGKIISIGKLQSGEQARLEVMASVKGSAQPYKVKTIYWREF